MCVESQDVVVLTSLKLWNFSEELCLPSCQLTKEDQGSDAPYNHLPLRAPGCASQNKQFQGKGVALS